MKTYRKLKFHYRIATLLSIFFAICAAAAFFGYPSIVIDGVPAIGLKGLSIGVSIAVAPLLMAHGYEKYKRTKA